METQKNEMYPILPEWERSASPSAPPLDGGQSYRLQKINELQDVFSKMNEKNVMGLSVAGVGILAKNRYYRRSV